MKVTAALLAFLLVIGFAGCTERPAPERTTADPEAGWGPLWETKETPPANLTLAHCLTHALLVFTTQESAQRQVPDGYEVQYIGEAALVIVDWTVCLDEAGQQHVLVLVRTEVERPRVFDPDWNAYLMEVFADPSDHALVSFLEEAGVSWTPSRIEADASLAVEAEGIRYSVETLAAVKEAEFWGHSLGGWRYHAEGGSGHRWVDLVSDVEYPAGGTSFARVTAEGGVLSRLEPLPGSSPMSALQVVHPRQPMTLDFLANLRDAPFG